MEKRSTPLIYSAIAAIMGETKAVTKDRKNTSQNFMFRGIDDVMNELHALFAKHQVFILPEVMDYDVSEKITEKYDSYSKQNKKSILYYTRAKIKFHFTASDGSEVVTINVGEAMDSGDKGMNKAMSIALKYSLMQMLLIPTEEDKDPDATTPPPSLPQTIQDIIDSLDVVKDAELHKALTKVNAVSSLNDLQSVWKEYPELQANKIFTKCVSSKKKEYVS